MILSRFWYFVLTVTAVFAFATALLASSLVNEQWHRATVNELVRDRFEVEAMLKLDARSRLDAIAPIAANSDVRSALRRASGRSRGESLSEEVTAPLERKLVELNRQLAGMQGDLLFAVDRGGWIVASVAPGSFPAGAGLGAFPLVRRALEGFARDDVWVYNEGVYRMAARPVIDGGQYVGALIHGKRFDDQLAALLSQRLDGASIGFFHGEAMFAGHMPSGVQGAPRRDDMGAALGAVLSEEAETLQQGERTDPQELPTGGLAVFSLVTGTARHAGVGYAIARPVRSLAQPMDILNHVSGEAWGNLPWSLLGGTGFVLFLLAMLLLWLERDRPLGKLRAAASLLPQGPEARLTITDFGGRYRQIAQSVNAALDKSVEAAVGPKRRAANLDEILGPAAGDSSSGTYFGFAKPEQPEPDFLDIPPASPPSKAVQPALSASAGGRGAPAPLGTPAAKSPPAAPEGRAPVAAPPLPSSPAATRPAPPKPPKPPEPPAPPPTADPWDDATQAVEPSFQRTPLKSTLVGNPPPADDNDGATMVASVPRELIERSVSEGDDERKHFREVFEEFVAMKKKCGEPTDSLTYEKFAVTLRKNRDQIVKRHGANKVRFSVYEKSGKAALKATPIKH